MRWMITIKRYNKKVNTAGNNDSKEPDMGDNNNNNDNGNDNEGGSNDNNDLSFDSMKKVWKNIKFMKVMIYS
jgi:hypothetical protein